MKHWRVTYFDKPFEERKTPQDFMHDETQFDSHEMAEEKASMLEKSSNAYDVKISIWDGDSCIEELFDNINDKEALCR